MLAKPLGGRLDEIGMLVEAGQPPAPVKLECLGQYQRGRTAAELDDFGRPQPLDRADHSPQEIGVGLPTAEVGQRVVRQAEPV